MAGALTAAIAAAFAGSAAPSSDPYFEYTTLLLPGNGTNGAQNNTFLDGSTNNFTITRNGNTTQGTFSPFSQTGWGNYFDGSGDYLSVASNAAFAFGTGDFTIEFWFYPLTGTARNITFPTVGAPIFYMNGSRQLQFETYGAPPSITTTNTLNLNAWNHCAVSRASGTVKVFVNGVAGVTSTAFLATNFVQSSVNIGTDAGSNFATGYMSNVRIVKGTAVYTSDFTPPTTPLAAISGTSLLTCQSNRFIDASSNNFTITVNGNTSVQAFSPFNPTASWSAATNGGSGYFDGNGDYLTVANSAALSYGTGSFTIEGWFYTAATGQYASIFSDENAAVSTGLTLLINPTVGNGQLVLYGNGSLLVTATGKYNDSAWHHFAISRDSTNLRLYVDGAYIGNSASGSTNFDASQPLYLMSSPISGRTMAGYLSSFRALKGTALYTGTGTITVPTAPLTNIANTSLLLNFTNAGIYDATSKNDLETVGNAQISTTQSKWGGSSMSFDGTGDWLLIPDQPIRRIGTGNFTIEGWVYRNSSGTYGLIGKGTGTTGWLVSLNSSNQVVFTYGSSTITSTGTVSATTWTHIAVVREGTSTNQTKIYINGTNDGTGTVSTDFNQTNSMYVGADRTGGSAANAYMQDVRVTNYARYTTNFTAPTAAFPTL
jgi:hypothetical protein